MSFKPNRAPLFRPMLSLALASLAISFVACLSRPIESPAAAVASPSADGAGGRAPTSLPPAGLKPAQVPQFVVFGFDDNGFSGLPESGKAGGMRFALDLLKGRKNGGHGNAATFDGASWHGSFYVVGRFGREQVSDEPANVRKVWAEAFADGHEIGLHTDTHGHGREYPTSTWHKEITACLEVLTSPSGLGLPRARVTGFRSPYLEYNDALYDALKQHGLRYDCSIEEGWQASQNGKDFLWPYTLDQGSPGNEVSVSFGAGAKPVKARPGIWELPAYAMIAPPDSEAAKYGIEPGLRSRLKKRVDYFDESGGKLTGFDWNLWIEFGLNRKEFVATVKHTLSLRLAGNRAPLLIGAHSDIYSDGYPDPVPQASAEERRQALREIADHLATLPTVRVVSAQELLAWLEKPAPL